MERRESEGTRPTTREYTEAEDLYILASFFAVNVESEQMQRLTGLDPTAIRGIFDGSIRTSDRRNHTDTLGKFARISREALSQYTAYDQSINNDGLNLWLEEGEVKTSRGLMKPIDALSDSRLALEALKEVEEEAFS